MSASLESEGPRLSIEGVSREPAPPPPPVVTRRDRLRTWFAMLAMEAQQGVSQVCAWRVANPCGVMLTGRPDPQPEMLAALPAEQHRQASAYCDELHPAGRCDTPLVVAFASEPVQFASHLPTATTPWLALDRDGDGAITSRAELFGDATLLGDGTTATNGFVALAALDSNGDGVIDHADPAFARLLLWSDRDLDRTSTPSELRPAAEVLVSIPLANHRDVRCTADDDCEGERGTVLWRAADGSERTGAVVDVYLHR